MLEILIFSISGVVTLFVAGYAVHMFVGGLVSAETEQQLIIGVCALLACVMGYMVWDVVQRRRGGK